MLLAWVANGIALGGVVAHRDGRAFNTAVDTLVNVGCLCVSNQPNVVFSAHGLSSCVAVILHDLHTRVGGMAHVQLPARSVASSSLAADDSVACADQAVPELLKRFCQEGGNLARARITLVGGAHLEQAGEQFQIGELNYRAVLRLLRSHDLEPHVERVGGSVWRSVKLTVGTGSVTIQTPEDKEELLP